MIALLVSFAFLSAAALSQESDEETVDATTAETTVAEPEPELEPEPEPEPEVPEFDETGLDEQGFSDEDDDFNPSEDIPADQSIDFPADI